MDTFKEILNNPKTRIAGCETGKKIIERYDSLLNFNKFRTIKIRENTKWNYSYYPIIFESIYHIHSYVYVFS